MGGEGLLAGGGKRPSDTPALPCSAMNAMGFLCALVIGAGAFLALDYVGVLTVCVPKALRPPTDDKLEGIKPDLTDLGLTGLWPAVLSGLCLLLACAACFYPEILSSIFSSRALTPLRGYTNWLVVSGSVMTVALYGWIRISKSCFQSNANVSDAERFWDGAWAATAFPCAVPLSIELYWGGGVRNRLLRRIWTVPSQEG